MKGKHRFAIGLGALLFCVLPPGAQEPPPAPATDLLQRARAAYEARSDNAQAKASMDLYGEMFRGSAPSYESLWEGARSCFYYGQYARAEAADSERMAIYQEGIYRAKAAVSKNDKGVEGHFWLGVLYGAYGEAKGIFKALGMVPDIRAEMDICLRQDESVECFGPDRLLGRMLFRLPWFKGGDNKKAIEHLEKAAKGCPQNALTRLYLAEVLEAEGMDDRARALATEIVRESPDQRWVPEHKSIKAMAEKLLKKMD